MERKKRYNQEFVVWIERKCQDSGAVQPVDDECYEAFVSLTKEHIVVLAMLILHETARVFNKKLGAGVEPKQLIKIMR